MFALALLMWFALACCWIQDNEKENLDEEEDKEPEIVLEKWVGR